MSNDDARTVPVAFRPAELRAVRLVVLSGPDAGLERRAESRTLRVGTAPDSDLRLTDPSISRQHFELRLKRDEVRLVDLGSTNGTRVEDVQVVEAVVRPGQRIAIGGSVLRVVSDETPLRLPMSGNTQFGRLLGASAAMREAYAFLERMAVTEVSVLIEGESGTGKELAAEGIHTASRRRKGPFVVVDCSSIPANLFESELFGHTKGSFTGASEERRGMLEEANGGTVFLDEIGELPTEQQAKLLRALERREIKPVGSNKVRPIDVRIVAATNRNLASEVNRGTFREDLYYRLAGARVTLPPLHARGDDLAILVRHFVQLFEPAAIGRVDEITASLQNRRFPGNVRELRNAVQFALALDEGELGSSIPPPDGGAGLAFDRYLELPYGEAAEAVLIAFQHRYVKHALEREQGNVSAAARRTAMSRRYLQRILAQLGLRGDQGG